MSIGFNIENFPSKGMSDVFGDADDTSEAFFGVRRKASFNSFIVDLLPEMVTKKNANVNGNAKQGSKGNILDVVAPCVVEDKGNIHEGE